VYLEKAARYMCVCVVCVSVDVYVYLKKAARFVHRCVRFVHKYVICFVYTCMCRNASRRLPGMCVRMLFAFMQVYMYLKEAARYVRMYVVRMYVVRMYVLYVVCVYIYCTNTSRWLPGMCIDISQVYIQMYTCTSRRL